jgi:hypothetical protein
MAKIDARIMEHNSKKAEYALTTLSGNDSHGGIFTRPFLRQEAPESDAAADCRETIVSQVGRYFSDGNFIGTSRLNFSWETQNVQ